jgi:hypothetical protein
MLEGFEPFLTGLAQAADLCLKPHHHALRIRGESPATIGAVQDCCLLIEVRDAQGIRHNSLDLELEIYRSGSDLNLMLSRLSDDNSPVLWHGNHPVWMDSGTGERCERPADGAPMEALCRRIRALLA